MPFPARSEELESPDYRFIFLEEPCLVRFARHVQPPVPVPSYVESPGYAAHFGNQWRDFRDVQLDSRNGTSISRDFLSQLLGEPLSALRGQTVLEVGAGAGRFTEHLVRHARLVVTVDLSEGILYNAALGAPNLVAAQADLLRMPPLGLQFDLVLCRGVLQHLPDPRQGIRLLPGFAKAGGRVVFDIYGPGRLGRWAPKYLWRPLLQRFFSYSSFKGFLDRYAEKLLTIRRLAGSRPGGLRRRLFDYLIPIWDYRGVLPLTQAQLVQWAKLDTLDAFFAVHDHPLTFEEVLETLAEAPVKIISADPSRNFFRLLKTC